MTHFLDSPALVAAIENRLLGMLNRVQAVTGLTVTTSLGQIVTVSAEYGTALAGERGEVIGQRLAEQLRDNLILPAEMYQSGFWDTELGRAIAWWTGGPKTGWTRPGVAELLGCTRQYVHRLIRTGQLEERTWITAESVRATMRAKYPHEIAEVAR